MDHTSELTPVAPVRPVAGYIGGKRQLAKRLVDAIAKVPHETYAEPFVGMAGVFFRRTAKPRAEVINDRSGEVANLFRILQRHYQPFMETLRWQLTGRREFNRLLASNAETLTDLERAARFLYLQKTAFGGKVVGRSFGVSIGRSAAFNLTTLAPMLEDVYERLAGVIIENLDWLEFVNRYDRLGTLFYIDPPYHGSEGDYGRELFSRDQFELMADRLGRLQGKFILSINDLPAIRETFAAFKQDEVDLTYTIAGGNGRPARELIISGR